MAKYDVKNGYTLSKFDHIFSRMIEAYPNIPQSLLLELRRELNTFFTKAKCMGVIFTKNSGMFFGMKVYPVLSNEDTFEIVLGDSPKKIEKYQLEIDSKLFDLGLTSRECSSIILHELGHLVLSDVPVKQLRAVIDDYTAKNDDVINLKNSAQYTQILSFGIKDLLMKMNSMFYMNDEEVRADSFVALCGYGEELESAETKILNNAWGLSQSYRDQTNPLAILVWTLDLYKNVKFKRIPALHTLRKAKSLSSSELTKQEVDNLIDSLNKIDTDIIAEGAMILQEAKKGLIGKIKVNGLKAMEEDLYEFTIRSKTMEDEDDALYLMRQLNARISILADTLEDESLSDADRKRWYKLEQDYKDLRLQVANKNFHRKHYGLFYDFDDLDANQKKDTMYTYGY